jgi:hypothetical protein
LVKQPDRAYPFSETTERRICPMREIDFSAGKIIVAKTEKTDILNIDNQSWIKSSWRGT